MAQSSTGSGVAGALARAGGAAGWLSAGATLALVVVAVVGPKPPAGARAFERLEFVLAHEGWYAATWALLVAAVSLQVLLWLGLGAMVRADRPGAAVAMAAFGLLGSAFVGWGAWTQLTTVRGLAHQMAAFPFDVVAQFRLVGFEASLSSAGYSTVVFGAAAWGVAGWAAWRALRPRESFLAVLTGSLFGLTGILLVVGAVGFAADSGLLRGGVLLGGALSVFAVATGAALLRRDARRLTVPEERP